MIWKENAPQPKVILTITKDKAYETDNQEGKIRNYVKSIRYTWKKGKGQNFEINI